MASKLSQFLGELKRRKVTRVAVVYALVGIGVIEGAQLIFEALELPQVAWQVLTIIVLLGFPVALVLAWAVDLTSTGIQRASPAAEAEGGGTEGDLATGGGSSLAPWALAGVTAAVVVLGALWIFPRGPGSGPREGAEERVPIAVLPFDTHGGGEEAEALTNGIHDDILTQLSKIHSLRVTSRTSVMEYRGAELNMRRIGEELGVQAILEGGVQKAGEQIRINAQLIDARTDEHLWGETYDRPYSVEELFAIQSDLAEKIVAALHAVLQPEEAERIAALPTRDTVAYGLLLRGRELEEKSEAEHEAAIELFRQAIRIDSLFAVAYGELAFAFFSKIARYGASIEWADSVLLMAQRAVDLDPDLPQGHNTLGVAYSLKGRLSDAREAYLRAVELNPSYGGPLNNLGFDAQTAGRCDEAYVWHTRAHEVNPRASFSVANLADASICLDMDEEALRWLTELEVMDPDFFALTPYWIGFELQRGNLEDALRRAETRLDVEPSDLFTRSMKAVVVLFGRDAEAAESEFGYLYREFPGWGIGSMPAEIRTGLAWALLQQGDEIGARELLEEAKRWLEDYLASGAEDRLGALYHHATSSALSGAAEEALTWLRRAFEEGGGGGYQTVARDPRLDNISDDSRFTALIQEMAANVDSMRARVERGEVDLGIG
jgi:TolB-like protein